MAQPLLETPSRVWRRIEANQSGHDMPSLPSLPGFEDSQDHTTTSESEKSRDFDPNLSASVPLQSTPAALSAAPTLRPSSSTSSTARFAHSINSRQSRSVSGSIARSSASSLKFSQHSQDDISFDDVSAIPTLPQAPPEHDSMDDSDFDAGEFGPPVDAERQMQGEQREDDDLSLTDALQSVSRTSSPYPPEEMENDTTRKKFYDYSVSLKSEPKASPFGKFRNVSFRKNLPRADTRTPSLSRTTPSPTSSSSHSTPHSTHSFGPNRSRIASPFTALSVPLPPSNNGSPAPESPQNTRSPAPESSSDRGSRDASSDEHRAEEDTSDMQLDVTLPDVSLPETDMREDEARNNQSGTPSGSEAEASDQREPTFSSEEALTPLSRLSAARSPALSAALSSPTPSTLFTPTPAFQPRPRARFNSPSTTPVTDAAPAVAPAANVPSTPGAFQPDIAEEQDPTTPFARRRSFLMDVINSTARPRYANPTPHPHRMGLGQSPIPSIEETPASESDETQPTDESTSPAAPLQAAFAGLTPGRRARRRLSHPLAQAWTAGAPAESESGDAQSDAGSQSPYERERASFVSTASSHDLTAHPRANASFDPVMGLGAGGHGVGRFNAGKLNSYLHGLNRRLQEENETLTVRCGGLQRENEGLVEEVGALRDEVRKGGRRSSGGRRVSDIGSSLGNVREDVGGEGWMEEKVAMEEELEALRAELEHCVKEKAEAESNLDEEKDGRAKDREKWKQRMGEVERGVEDIVRNLENKLEVADARAQDAETRAASFKEVEKILAEVEGERDYAIQRAEKAERMLENGKELGGELRETNEKLGKAMADLRNALSHIKDLEEEAQHADNRIGVLEQQLKEERGVTRKLEDELETKDNDLAVAEQQISVREDALRKAESELQSTKAFVAELEQDAEAAVERIESTDRDLAMANQQINALAANEERANEEIARLQDEVERNVELARQMEDAIEAAENQMHSDSKALADLRSKFASLERAQERSRSRSRVELSQNHDDALEEAAEQMAEMERELDDAHREIGRLNAQLTQSPARKALDKARDTRIEALEKERDDLLERVKSLKSAMVGMNSPNKFGTPTNISPMHRQVLNMTMRTPKTPGAPLKDMSWLHPSMSDPSTSPYFAEIQRLQRELDRANESIDEKLDRLEDAGFGVVELTQQLEDERARNVALDEELARLSRREERRIRRLERARCLKCKSKVDLSGLNRAAVGDESSVDISHISLPSEPPTPPTRTSEVLRGELQSVNRQLTLMKRQWEDEKRQLLGDKAVLQDAANRLNLEVQDAKQRVAEQEKAKERAKAGIQGDLDQAKRVIAELEEDLKAERARLRGLSTEQVRAEREKTEVMLQLRRTESDMEDVKHQLQRLKRDNNELETELRQNATAEQKARLLESRAAANAETIEQLRSERSQLAADHKALQKRFAEASKHMSQLRDEHAASQHSHDARRHALDLRLLEIDDLKRELAERTEALHAAQAAAPAREEADQRALAALEADLARVRKNAEALGRDLRRERERREAGEVERRREKEGAREMRREVERMRAEVERAERGRKQVGAEVRVLRDRVGELEGERGAWVGHAGAGDQNALVALGQQHKLESKGLILQITYLKAKFLRETNLRADLGNQKKYLLLLLARHDRGDAKILAAIARIGFPFVLPEVSQPKRKTLRMVGRAVLFLERIRRASEQWRKQCEHKDAIRDALQDVRRRRQGTQEKDKGPVDGGATPGPVARKASVRHRTRS